ncbi:MAG: MaoC family dehydratase [Desulfobacterales bacterium]|nr:MaoC family dehydratase [Desulfobacterales bacterium]MDD3950573.1 MaoC family dehydratase [Desulfobacterales bacterium]
MSHIRKKAVGGLEAGETFSVSRTFSELDVIQFADISRDYNPVHFDERFSKVKNFDNRICHGLLVASLLTEIGGQIGWLASGMSFEFKKPVYFGDTIRCDFTITEMDVKGRAKAEVVFTNENDIIVLEAVLTGIVPGVREKKVLKDMLAEGDPTNKISL